MKLKHLILGLGLLPATLFAQENIQETRVSLSFIIPQLRIETQIAEITSLKFGVGYMPVGEYENVNGEVTKNTIESLISVSIEPRFYVSRKRRLEMAKSTNYFSGGYIGIPASMYVSKGFSFGALYGTQGMFGSSKLFFYNVGIGLGYINIELEKNKDLQGADFISEIALGIRLK